MTKQYSQNSLKNNAMGNFIIDLIVFAQLHFASIIVKVEFSLTCQPSNACSCQYRACYQVTILVKNRNI